MAFDAYMQVDGIPGESTDDAHKDWIELINLKQVVDLPTSAASSSGARSAEKAHFGPFIVRKRLDKSSPKLAVYSAQGTNIATITIELARSAGDRAVYMKYVLSDSVVSTYSMVGEALGEDTLPVEEVAFNFTQIEWTYTAFDPKTSAKQGDVATNWDLSSNTGG